MGVVSHKATTTATEELSVAFKRRKFSALQKYSPEAARSSVGIDSTLVVENSSGLSTTSSVIRRPSLYQEMSGAGNPVAVHSSSWAVLTMSVMFTGPWMITGETAKNIVCSNKSSATTRPKIASTIWELYYFPLHVQQQGRSKHFLSGQVGGVQTPPTTPCP